MLQSMTGFGKASAQYADKKITVEIKSLNSKQFDLSMKMPSLYREKELIIRSMVAKVLGRGKVDLSIYTESPEGDRNVTINHKLAQLYLDQIRDLAEKSGLQEPEGLLTSLLGFPEVLKTERPELSDDEWKVVQEAVKNAAAALNDFRISEGKRLEMDIVQRVKSIEKLTSDLEPHLEARIKEVRERILNNIAELIQKEQADQNRLEQEIVYYLEKLDITEEDIRLKSHCKYFLDTLNESEEAGKKLGFISQEMGREINTMGSKANYVPIQQLVVQMKDELEKIKEQLLNIR
ncbi:MAG TPA: YicC/YloC family endoribonuclease [Cryomorphaceae bacterium]|nr:YicC/YloC family endoribonuclease [Cryomorphaceae bacterium]